MGRRTFLLIASIVVAAIGTGLVAIYVNNADNRARAGEQLVNVYVTKEIIAANSPAYVVQQKVQQEPLPRRLVPKTAVTDLRTIAGKVTTAQIFPRTPIVTEMFGQQSQASANVVPLGNEMGALSVQMTDSARLAGLLQPGSQVEVFSTSDEGGAVKLFDRVTVLSPGGTFRSATGERVTTPTTLVTLEIPLKDAERTIEAISAGSLYLVLLSGGAGSGVQG
jgi:pilus assembly protein CpaB